MDSFTISQLGQYAGVRPHTIRTWEKRYNALKPNRSKGNTRSYDGVQMRRMLNIVSLIQAGYKVSELCLLSDDQLVRLLEKFFSTEGNEPAEYFISQLIAAGMTYDEAYFDKVFSRYVSRYQLKQTYLLVLLPLLNRIGLMWKCNKATVAHEHFISNLLRQKLLCSADSISPAGNNASKWLLFLPEHQFHEIGLLMAYILIRLSGHRAIFLGSNVPRQAIRSAIRQIEPDNLLVFLVNRDYPKSLKSYLHDLDRYFEGGIYIANHGGLLSSGGTVPNRIQWLASVDELTTLLTSN